MEPTIARFLYPWLRNIFADGGSSGDKLAIAPDKIGRWTVEIVKRGQAVSGFVVLRRRWVVERTLAWLNRNRRLAKDFEARPGSACAWHISPAANYFFVAGYYTFKLYFESDA